MLQFAIASLADIGKKRQYQQDKVLHKANLGLVCDGMGGAGGHENAGAKAAEVATDKITTSYDVTSLQTVAEARAWIRQIIGDANNAVVTTGNADRQYRNMGSTIVLGVFVEDTGLIGWLGDSRGYHLSAGVLTQVTHDHSLAQLLADQGQIAQSEVANHRYKDVLNRHAGSGRNPHDQGDLKEVALKAGDVILLCSDGIDKMLADTDIQRILASSTDPAVICQALVDEANNRGGRDNIGVVVIVVS